MKYFLASLIIPIGLILFIVVFGIGALYFGVAKLLGRMSRLMGKTFDRWQLVRYGKSFLKL